MSFFRRSAFFYESKNAEHGPSHQQQFIRYFKESGAARALENAMIHYYKLPMKLPSIAEYFAEYFDNGARDLSLISLLEAELRFKETEIEMVERSLDYLKKKLEKLEYQVGGDETLLDPTDTEGGGAADLIVYRGSEEVSGRKGKEDIVSLSEATPLAEFLENGSEFQLLNRFLEDVEHAAAPRNEERDSIATITSYKIQSSASASPSVQFSLTDLVTSSMDWIRPTKSSEQIYGPSAHKIEQIMSWMRDVKQLDPWGILSPLKKLKDTSGLDIERVEVLTLDHKHKIPHAVRKLTANKSGDIMGFNLSYNLSSVALLPPRTPQETFFSPNSLNTPLSKEQEYRMSKITSSRSCMTSEASFSDDADTLAENFHSYANMFGHEEAVDQKINQRRTSAADKKPKPRSKGKSKMGELLGWGDQAEDQDDDDIFPPKPYWPSGDAQEEDGDDDEVPHEENFPDPCLKEVDFYQDTFLHDQSAKLFPINPTSESFLLEPYDISKLARRIENVQDPDFMFEFYKTFAQFSSKDKDVVCGHCKKPRKSESETQIQEDTAATSAYCGCEEDQIQGHEGQEPSEECRYQDPTIFQDECLVYCHTKLKEKRTRRLFQRKTSKDPELEKAFRQSGHSIISDYQPGNKKRGIKEGSIMSEARVLLEVDGPQGKRWNAKDIAKKLGLRFISSDSLQEEIQGYLM